MSSGKTEKSGRSKPHVHKFEREEETEKASSNPCIDFQPDDRWQIKDEEEEEEEECNKRRRSSRKRKNDSQNATNDVPTVNGESTKTDPDNDKESKQSNADKIAKEKLKKNGPVSKKLRSTLSCDKLPSDKEESHSPNAKNGISEEVSDCENLPNETLVELSKTSVAKDTEVDSENKSKETAPVLEDERTKNEPEVDTKEDVSASQNDSNKNENMPELSSNENSQSSLKKDDVDIAIIDEKITNAHSDAESDGDIQIINSTCRENPQSTAVVEEKLYQQSLSKDKQLSKEEMLLSAGFPYFNSLKEKIENFGAGKYKPVKFPHMGTLMLEENEVIIESPSLLVPLLIKEADEFPVTTEEGAATNSDNSSISKLKTFRRNFFQSSVGQFLINLGASRVLEWYHKDMKRSKQKQLRKAGGIDRELEDAIDWHQSKLKSTKDANGAFNFPLRKCMLCNYKTESRLVLEGHCLTPHLTSRREFRCSFCNFLTRDIKEISFHVEAIHEKRIVTEDQMQLHECLFCSFHSHLKSKVNVHMNRCRKNFLPSQNQGPPFDFEFPGVTTKPVTIADVIAHRRMLMGTTKPPFPNSGQSVLDSAVSALARKKLSSVLGITGSEGFADSPTLIKHLMGPQSKQAAAGFQLPPGIVLTRPRVRAQQIKQITQSLQPRIPGLRPGVPRSTAAFAPNITSTATHLASSGISITPIGKQDSSTARISQGGTKNITLTPISSAGNQVVSQTPGPPQPVALFTNVAGSDITRTRPGMVPISGQGSRMPLAVSGRPSRMMPPFQRLNTPPSQVVKNSSGGSFVLCEICDSYIKDLEELRSHMNWVHKVKIHPKMLVSRPPLNCQKCQWRFFTDQGLERHLLGAHGLVTTNMQEMANKNQDGGRCIICGAVFTYKLVSHMTQVHKVTLKPAHLSYKCTVCTATFTLYRLFESHVYNVHSASAKRPADESAPNEPPTKKSVAPEAKSDAKKEDEKKVKENEQQKQEGEKKTAIIATKCKHCGQKVEDEHKHLLEKHIKQCSVKLCRIEKCEKCLNSSGEMLVMHLSDFEDDSDSEEEEDDSSEEDKDDSSSKEF